MEWISVKDRLPEKPGKANYEHVHALVYVPRWGVMILAWNCEHLCWDSEDGDDEVKYWMPLHEPPKV